MKRLVISFFMLLILSNSVVYADMLDEKYTPTKREWLQVYLFTQIAATTDAWAARFHYVIDITEQQGESVIYVTVSTVNKEQIEDAKHVKDVIESIVRDSIDGYDWLKDADIIVQVLQ